MIVHAVKMDKVFASIRLDSSFFLNTNALNSSKLEDNLNRCLVLGDVATVFNPPIFKRQFCQKTPNAVPYCQSSDVVSSFDGSSVYVNKNQVERINAIVKKNQILVTGFGAIGNVRLVNELSEGNAFANNVCRIEGEKKWGFYYAFLASKYGRSQLNKNASGSVVRYIEAPGIKKTLIPILKEEKEQELHKLIVDAAELRVEANRLLKDADSKIHLESGLADLKSNEYEYFGTQPSNRETSTFVRSIKEISSITINAFNNSEKISKLRKRVENAGIFKYLVEVLDEKKLFKTGSFPRLELNSPRAIQLVNQSDIFDIIIKGKMISRRGVNTDNLVSYGEVLIAGVGTLGEGETFCRVVYANKDLVGQLVSGEFTRLQTNGEVPDGFLFAWLNSDYGFRFLRSIQAGTKLCRPIPQLLEQIPVPILSPKQMNEIHKLVDDAYEKRFIANEKERKAIKIIEDEIDQWQ